MPARLPALLATSLVLLLAGRAQAEGWTDRFQLHGHLTTAYAESSLDQDRTLFVEEAILGIPEDGTWDYRMAALQVRFEATERHSFVLQLSHRHFDDSLIDPFTDDVELDWLFWDWQLGQSTRLRLGRFATPVGIFNEIRDVGTLLPFFRPSLGFYREGSFFSETIDGIGISHRFELAGEWGLEADLYYGEFEVLEQSQGLGGRLREVDASGAFGGQVWLDTPIDGLRLGLGGLRWDMDEESVANPVEAEWWSWYASIDGNFERFVVRVEYRYVDIPIDLPPVFPAGGLDLDTVYAQIGWRVTPKLSFWLQAETNDVEQTHPNTVGGSFEYLNIEDQAVAVNYAFRPSLVLKGEYHEQELEDFAVAAVPTPSGLFFDFRTVPFSSEYFIVSLAYSF
ncbi:MAG: hypothetical protein MI919_06485 [Holophagales bacterium]|nr:hypothetical protein [Holophagales bacterium]